MEDLQVFVNLGQGQKPWYFFLHVMQSCSALFGGLVAKKPRESFKLLRRARQTAEILQTTDCDDVAALRSLGQSEVFSHCRTVRGEQEQQLDLFLQAEIRQLQDLLALAGKPEHFMVRSCLHPPTRS